MTIIDSHCHPQFSQYDKDREDMIERASNASIGMICVGTDLEMSKKAIELASKHEGMWATVGLHPNDNLNEDFDEGAYEELLRQGKVVAMGEIGLDYYRTAEPEEQKLQKDRFIKQLELAGKLKKPLILHCRDSKAGSTGRAYPVVEIGKTRAESAGTTRGNSNFHYGAYPEMIDILKNGYTKNGGVVHSYTGSLEEAKQFLNLGLYLGFNGIITFARQYDEIVRYVSLDCILLETDAPFLTPEPYRGKRNEPSYVIEVAKKVAELKGVTVEEIAEQTTKNCQNIFKLA